MCLSIFSNKLMYTCICVDCRVILHQLVVISVEKEPDE